jgi:ABC-2 type transport system permease protein
MNKSYFAGTGSLLWFMLRRDRIRLMLWVLGIAVFTILMAPYFSDMYPTAESRQMMAASMQGPATVLICGPVYSADNYTNGAMFSNYMLLFMGAFVAVMNILLIARHTRQDEELGRMDVVRSLPTGKLANMLSAMLLAVIANVLMTVLIALGLSSFGIEDIDLVGSATFAAALGAVGILFATATSVFCQLTANNRTATGIAFTFFGATYILRGIGDGGVRVLTVTSPFGLMHMTESYVRNLWWPILVILGAAGLVAMLAFRLGVKRDLGEGLVSARPGKQEAGALFSSPFSLSIRLIRGTAITWTVVLLVLCAVLGSLFGEIETMIGENTALMAFYKDSHFTIVEEFLTMLTGIMAIISSVAGVSVLMKLRSEEKNMRTEHLLARAVPRIELLASGFIPAMLMPVLLTVLGTLSLWGLASVTVEDVPSAATFFGASISYLPAIWAIVGMTAALIGIFPKASGVAFGYLGYCFFALFTVMMFGLPEWLEALSPFAYIPKIPVERMAWGNPILIFIIVVVLSVLGFMGYRKRDAVFY